LTQVVSAEPVVISAETLSNEEKIVKRKNIVYKALVDPELIKVAAKNSRNNFSPNLLFTGFSPR